MQVVVRAESRGAAPAARVVPLFEEQVTPPPRGIEPLVRALLSSGDFKARFLDLVVLHPPGAGVRRIVVAGLGARARLDDHRLRQWTANLVRRVAELQVRALSLPLAALGVADPERAAHVIAEGAVLGGHRYTRYRRAPSSSLARIELIAARGADPRTLDRSAKRGLRWGEAVTLARDLANTPGDDLTPAGLATAARAVAMTARARVRILAPPALSRLGMGALLAVGRGSVHEPRFIVLESGARPRGRRASRAASAAPVVLIGKGITFDTGGISLKPRDGMGRMKYDMSGAAAVLGVFAALPTLALPFPVVGLVPSAENMPGSRALKPGDVVRALDGTTIEVTNTDAEGRLVLADALGYARRYRPAVVIDVATLTGAIRMALGGMAAGLFTADEALAGELLAAGAKSGDRLWRMPLWDEFGDSLKSDVADLVNSAGPEGGASIAASFLSRFARDLAWAHLDIASTAWSFSERPHEPRGPTGFGVRLLLEWLAARAAS